MKTFMQKPVFVEAAQWFPHLAIEGIVIDGLNAGPNHPTKMQGTPLSRWVVLPDGEKIDIHPGDWIVRFPDGLGVVTNDYFRENYEPVTVDHRDVLEASMRSTNAVPRPVVRDDMMGGC